MASAATLYTPEVLALATKLASYPLGDNLPLRGNARSQSCGSVIEIGIALDRERITHLGLRSHACAIGQAAAAIFAAEAVGLSRSEIANAEREIDTWLSGGSQPKWPGIEIIGAAAAYPARHGAVMLPWRAALSALPTRVEPR